jgi:endonuclease/exonuclease/phosphatase family metal-dependent hydrolase
VLVAGNGSKISVISWAVAGGLATWAVARLAAVDRVQRAEPVAVPVVAATPHVAAVAPFAALGLRLARRRGPAALAALAATALGLMVQPRKVPRPQPAAGGGVLRVLSANMYFGEGDAEVIVALVREAGADVLCLQELTADAVTRLRQAGLDELMPHTLLELRGSKPASNGSGIYSRFPLGEGPAVPPSMMAQPTALLELPDGDEVELMCVHPCAPGVRRWGGPTRWHAELKALPPPGKLPRVLAGDFNSTLDHAVFRGVLRLGYADAAQQTGNALVPTWQWPGKNDGKRALLPLDHVLVSPGCAVRAFSVHAVPGSDHRAVYVEIQLPGR